jgi:hypothetical protein
MKGITRKRLVALLSAVGLAGTAASSAAQVVKGSEPSDKTQTSSTIKDQKSKQENKAATNDAAIKYRKAGGEQKAAQDVVSEKVGPDHVVQKSQALSHADAASKDASKMAKTAKENTAVTGQNQIKLDKASKGSKAAQSEAAQKAAQTTPK